MDIYLHITLICLALLAVITFLLQFLFKPDKFKNHRDIPIYKGLCLFDIDGTLTTGYDNEKSVDICLKAGYAVGISTAGSMYHPNNLLSFFLDATKSI